MDQCRESVPVLSKAAAERPESTLRDIHISPSDGEFLRDLLHRELQRFRGLVDIEKLRQQTNSNNAKTTAIPLSEKLGDYPSGGADLDHIVTYPPKLEIIPAKPIFLDLAWNYIGYADKSAREKPVGGAKDEEQKPQKRGWFWPGR